MSVKEFITAVKDDEADLEKDDFIEFKLDGRTMKAYTPTSGQLIMINATLAGRGQTNEQRFATMLNFLFSSMDPEDCDHIESRLMTRVPSRRLEMEQLEDIFSFLMEEWFGRPSQPSSDSAE